MGEVKACGICGSADLVPILDMGMQPLAERYGPGGERYPLVLLECQGCTLVQLSHIVGQRELFPPDHPYTTGTTAALRDHFAALALRLAPRPAPGVVVDIGANDGTLLAAYPPGTRRVAVEPTGQAAKCEAMGFTTYRYFFTAGLARTILRQHGPARAVTATNVLAHVPDPHDFMDGVRTLLAPDGVFVTENHDVAAITGGLQIDTVYHEHLRYYSLTSLARLLAAHGLQIAETERIPTHGGSLRVWARTRQKGVQRRATVAVGALHGMLTGITGDGWAVYGVGATTRATPLIHYAGIAPLITCVCEVNGSEKIGLTMPGTDIPIVDEARLLEDQPAYALLFAHHLAQPLMAKLRAAGYLGRFIVPLPKPVILDG